MVPKRLHTEIVWSNPEYMYGATSTCTSRVPNAKKPASRRGDNLRMTNCGQLILVHTCNCCGYFASDQKAKRESSPRDRVK